jgi:beta-galactosidase
VHSEGARVLGTYGEDFYAGTPALTEHAFGAGSAFYIASDSAEARSVALPDGRRYADMLSGAVVSGRLELAGYDTRILED